MKSKRKSKTPKSKSKKKKSFLGMKTNRLINASIIGLGLTLMIISFFAIGSMANAPWAGGWEIANSLATVEISSTQSPLSTTIDATGLKSTQYDIDGNFIGGVVESTIGCPDILTKTWYPYYLKQSTEGWIKTDEPYIVDSYQTPYIDEENNSFYIEYVQYSVGMDIQIQTVADTYYKSPLAYTFNYGWSFEKLVQDIVVRAKIWLNPWTPVGTFDENWTISGGWAGIMSGSVRKIDVGIAGDVWDENYGHVITGLMSQYQALNLFTYEDELIDEVSFTDETALLGVPNKLEAEVYCRLGAGAKYTSDWTGHWTSVAVRNVYVTYYLRFDFVSTLIYQLALGHQEEATPPDENNTGYAPEITPWNEFLAWMENLIPNFNQIMTILVLVIGGVLLIIVILKLTNRHKDN